MTLAIGAIYGLARAFKSVVNTFREFEKIQAQVQSIAKAS